MPAAKGNRWANRRDAAVVGAGDDQPDVLWAIGVMDERVVGLALEIGVKLAVTQQLGLRLAAVLPQELLDVLFRPALTCDQLRVFGTHDHDAAMFGELLG